MEAIICWQHFIMGCQDIGIVSRAAAREENY